MLLVRRGMGGGEEGMGNRRGKRGGKAHVDVPVDDFPGRGAGYFDAVDGCCCLGHGGYVSARIESYVMRERESVVWEVW